MKRILQVLGALAIGILVTQGGADALGTSAATTVSNVARVSWLNNGNSADTVSLASDTTVAKVAGDTLLVTADASLAIGETKVYVYEIYNTGNATDTLIVEVDSFGLYAGAASWTFTLYAETVGYYTSTAADSLYIRSVAPDAIKYCTVAVWSSSTPANSPDGSFGIFRLKIRAEGAGADTTGQYVGDNGVTYGYGKGSEDTSRATIAAARLALVKAITSVTMYGNPSMPLPGATILYTLTATNQGSATADSIVLRDTVPTNTTFDTASSTMANLGCSAVLAVDSGASGWTAQVSVVANPTSALYSTDWINLPLYTAAAGTIRHVRWVRQSYLAGEVATLRFRVLIN